MRGAIWATVTDQQKPMMKLSNKGFTLSELVLAAAILAFTFAGLLALFINCILLNEASRNLGIATGHAQYALEEIKNTPFASIQNATWDNAIISSKGLDPLEDESIVITMTVAGAKIKEVLVTDRWKDRGVRQRSLDFKTLITEP